MAYSTINKSTDYFNTKLFVGNSSTNAITGVGHQPDWTWIKRRDGGNGYSNFLFDAVRGVNKGISSNQNAAEITFTNGLDSFNSDGFTLGANSSGSGATELNYSNGNYVSWNWKAGGGQGSSNTDGSINTTYTSVNTTAGFSISKYTGTGSNATVGHGLGVAPSVIIFKNLISSGGSAEHWPVYHKSVAPTKGIIFNLTNSADTDSAYFNNTAPTNSVFSLGSADKLNKSGQAHIAYAFAEKKGYSKFGSYVGNNNVNGTFIYTGFKPKFLMVKQSNASGNPWGIVDATRNPGNIAKNQLFANTSGAENTSVDVIDLFSNGFKCRAADNTWNGEASGGKEYIYMAFGQSLVGSNNVPCTAR